MASNDQVCAIMRSRELAGGARTVRRVTAAARYFACPILIITSQVEMLASSMLHDSCVDAACLLNCAATSTPTYLLRAAICSGPRVAPVYILSRGERACHSRCQFAARIVSGTRT